MNPERTGSRLSLVLLVAFSLVMLGLMFWRIHSSRRVEDIAFQNSRGIALLLFQYRVDHDGQFPAGKSSTAVFQQLLDGKYTSDPELFYVPLPGKLKPFTTTLKPENVSYDVTFCDGPVPDKTPVVFITGYKVSYAPGAAVQPLFKNSDGRFPGLAVTYQEAGALVSRNAPLPNGSLPNGSIPNFISPSFSPSGHKFQQLTPDGPL